MFDYKKYQPFPAFPLPDRTWPNQQITQAPTWCSVDLRDGNQALINPMSIEKKTQFFKLLVKLGFKEIEVGFPSASTTEFAFVRKIIEEDLIPDDVSIQVLVQAREELIARTYESLQGIKQAIVHVYNSTSTVQRQQVFSMEKDGITQIAVQGAKWLQEYATKYPATDWTFQYSPESFTGTEMDYAVEICDAVIEQWQPQNGQKVIINLPATVEMSTPNVFADQIEYFCRNVKQRQHISISLHTHNDRGCAVAASELGLMAGADRIEGTLMGNGERTGNVDIITLGMNLYSQGINPELDFSDINEIISTIEYCNELPVPARHPWAGELVYTAFSGSHQDAIRKSIAYHTEQKLDHWQVAYLPIDPRDIDRQYDAIVRINSQSGKGGVALVLERDFGIELPKWMHAPISKMTQKETEKTGREISPQTIHQMYTEQFETVADKWQLSAYNLQKDGDKIQAEVKTSEYSFQGKCTGAVGALCKALEQKFGTQIEVTQFDEIAVSTGTSAKARACIAINTQGQQFVATAVAEDTSAATLQALLTAFSKSLN